MKRVVLVMGIFSCIALAACCGPKRWIQGDPGDATPLPTPVVLDSVEIGVGVDGGSGTESGPE
ncbi:hypothetical protein K8S19_10200 [bacterium]|nr:hypothetical protein [bacterium]